MMTVTSLPAWRGQLHHLLADHDPAVDGGLGRLKRLERGDVAQLGAQALAEPLDLPGCGRRPGLCAPLQDAVLPADLLEQHLDWLRPDMPAG
jgi:hypothetical protein